MSRSASTNIICCNSKTDCGLNPIYYIFHGRHDSFAVQHRETCNIAVRGRNIVDARIWQPGWHQSLRDKLLLSWKIERINGEKREKVVSTWWRMEMDSWSVRANSSIKYAARLTYAGATKLKRSPGWYETWLDNFQLTLFREYYVVRKYFLHFGLPFENGHSSNTWSRFSLITRSSVYLLQQKCISSIRVFM